MFGALDGEPADALLLVFGDHRPGSWIGVGPRQIGLVGRRFWFRAAGKPSDGAGRCLPAPRKEASRDDGSRERTWARV